MPIIPLSLFTFLIFTLSISVLLMPRIRAQIMSDRAVQTEEEVRQFALGFIKEFEKTKDIARIGRSRFVSDFMGRYVRHGNLFEIKLDILKSESERVAFAERVLNTFYLVLMTGSYPSFRRH